MEVDAIRSAATLWDYSADYTPYFIWRGHDDLAKGLIDLGGNRFATSSEDGFLRIWSYEPVSLNDFIVDVEDEVEAHDGYPVNDLVYYPTMKWIISCGDDHTVRLWDSEGLDMIAEFTGHTDFVSRVIVGGDYLYSSSKDKRIGVWNLLTLENVTFLEGHTDWVSTMAVSPDNKSLLSASLNNQIIEWELGQLAFKAFVSEGGTNHYIDVSGKQVYVTSNRHLFRGHQQIPEYAVWGEDSTVYSSADELIAWDSTTWEIRRSFAFDVNNIRCFIIKDSWIITFSKLLKIYHLDTGELIKEYPNPQATSIVKAVFTGDGNCLLTTDKDGMIMIWDWNGLMQQEYHCGIGSDMHSLEVFHADREGNSGVAVGGGFVSAAGIWDVSTGKMLGRIEGLNEPGMGQIRLAKLHNRSDQVLLMYSGKIGMTSPFNPSEQRVLELPNSLFHPEAAVGTRNGLILGSLCYLPYYLNLDTDEIRVFDTRFSYRKISSVSPDQKYALGLAYPQSLDSSGAPYQNQWEPVSSPLVLIDLENEAPIHTFWCSPLWSWIKLHKKWESIKKWSWLVLNYPSAAAWSGDGTYLAAGFSCGQIIIWNVQTRRRVKKLRVPDKAYIYFLGWQENGMLTAMYTSSKKGKIVQIDPLRGRILDLKVLQGGGSYFKASYQHGRYLIWADQDNRVGIFDGLKFEGVYEMTAEVKPRSIRIDQNRLLIGGEDGVLYGYSLDGIL